jgi:hypothetical protein
MSIQAKSDRFSLADGFFLEWAMKEARFLVFHSPFIVLGFTYDRIALFFSYCEHSGRVLRLSCCLITVLTL